MDICSQQAQSPDTGRNKRPVFDDDSCCIFNQSHAVPVVLRMGVAVPGFRTRYIIVVIDSVIAVVLPSVRI